MKPKAPLFFLFLVMSVSIWAQKKITTEEYIHLYHTIAIEKMQDYKIPASITLAQGLLESGTGNSILAREANNHFGIKCHVGWEGKTFFMDDDEKNECFRAYRKPEDSFSDHSLFLTQRPRYASLFQLDIMDYKAWANGLSRAGYATNPRYPELLIGIIERNSLFHYDSLAMGKTSRKQNKKHEPDKIANQHVPRPSDFPVVGKTKSGRFLHLNNHTKLVFATEGEEIGALAAELGVYSWQLLKYNDLAKDSKLKAGQIIYVEKKSRKSKTHAFHLLEKGQSVSEVSQIYGVRVERIEKMNHWDKGFKPPAGTKVRLR